MNPGLPREVGELGKKQQRRVEGREPGEQFPGAREESHRLTGRSVAEQGLEPRPQLESSTLFSMSTTLGWKVMPGEALGTHGDVESLGAHHL